MCVAGQAEIAKADRPGLSMCRVYNLSPEDLFFKYEAFLMTRPSGLRAKMSTFTLDVARELRKEVQRENQSKALNVNTAPRENVASVRKKPRTSTGGNDLGSFLDGLTTPVRKPKPATNRLSNTGNNANILPSPTMATPSRGTPSSNGATPMGPTASSYRPSAPGPSRMPPPAVTPIGKSGGEPSSPIVGTDSPNAYVLFRSDKRFTL